VLLAFGAGLVLASVVAVRMGVTQADVQTQHLGWGILVGQLASYALIVPVLIRVLPWLARRSLGDLGLRPLDRRTLTGGLIGAAAMYGVTILVAGIQYGFTQQKPQEAATALFASSHDPLLTIAFGVLAVLIAPFVEELAFRGFLFNVVLRYTPLWVAALVSGAIFGLSHGSLSAFVPLAASGVVLAYVYYFTGSLTASMLTHALFNAINLVLLALGKAT
jgi:membrane protease YdiL (CAAX protease family)